VALLRAIPDAIPPILAEDRDEVAAADATTAVFYSISNCQEGLRGISFGNFLIKQVVEELRRDLPGLKTFVTLSPVPGFRAWLTRAAKEGEGAVVKALPAEFRAALSADGASGDVNSILDDAGQAEALREPLRALCAHYLVREKGRGTRPLDPVARFHLGNGARLERVHWNADPSANGRRQSLGLMVNYLYDLGEIERNHEAFAATGLVAASSSVSRLLKAVPEQKKQTPDPVE
jgi:malonyl-CoA decarboxylase